MENFIEVIDDLLPLKTINFLDNYIHSKGKDDLPKFPLIYTPNLTQNNPNLEDYGFSNQVISPPNYSIYPNSLPFLSPLFTLCLYKNITPLNIYFTRVFLQTPKPYTQSNQIHTDLKFPHWVCLYYVNDSDGDTIFYKNDRKTEIKRVSPKKGRIVFFNGDIPHDGGVPSFSIRTVINISFQKYNL